MLAIFFGSFTSWPLNLMSSFFHSFVWWCSTAFQWSDAYCVPRTLSTNLFCFCNKDWIWSFFSLITLPSYDVSRCWINSSPILVSVLPNDVVSVKSYLGLLRDFGQYCCLFEWLIIFPSPFLFCCLVEEYLTLLKKTWLACLRTLNRTMIEFPH